MNDGVLIEAKHHPMTSPECDKDPRVITLPTYQIEMLKRAVPRDVLLQATIKAEVNLIEQRRAQGIKIHGCGSSDDDGHVNTKGKLGSSYEHILEHALCYRLNRHGPLDEQAAGWTRWNPEDPDSEKIVTHVTPPPSMKMQTAQQIIDSSIQMMQKQYMEDGNVYLEVI